MGITSSGSISTRLPNPLQSTHMPWGLLKEKLWGVSSGNERLQWLHAIFSENTRSDALGVETINWPCPTFSADSTDSVTRLRAPLPTTTRSITASTVCRRRLSRASRSSVKTISPSTRSRTKPARNASAMSSRCSPFRFTNSGARITSRVPTRAVSSSRAICWAVWLFTVRPQR